MPLRNGCIPEAPEGGHSTHAGTLTEGAAVAPPADPPEMAPDDDTERELPVALVRPVVVPAVDVTARVDTAPGPPDVAAV